MEILLEQSNHTIAFLPAGRSQATVFSKRDVRQQDAPSCSRWKQQNKMPEHTKMAEHTEMATSENESHGTKMQSTDDHQSEENGGNERTSHKDNKWQNARKRPNNQKNNE